MRTHNFFNLRDLKTLYAHLHNKPECLFSTVGEAIKWRDTLVSQEDIDQAKAWSFVQQRENWLVAVGEGTVEASDHAIDLVMDQIEDKKWAVRDRSNRRMADIRAITSFLIRCGLTV